jgi:hypothetical protein
MMGRSVRKLSDRLETAVFWTCLIGTSIAVLTILFFKGATKETVNAVRQKIRPTCSKRSCPLPPEFGIPSDEPSEPEDLRK